MNGPDGWRFPWGKIVCTHEIGDFEIIEYKRTISQPDRKYAEASTFHPYIKKEDKWVDTSESFNTLDQAIVGVLACKYRGFHSASAHYACLVLNIPVE